MAMHSIDKTVFVERSIQKVWDFIVTPTRQIGLMPGLERVDNATEPMTAGGSFDFVYKMAGVKLAGEWTATRVEPHHLYEGRSSGDVTSFWRYSLKQVGSLAHVDLHVDYYIPESVLGRLAEAKIVKTNQQAATDFLEHMRLVLEQSY